ncbi:MAG: class I SAM-dependent methyltransferase [Bacteroidetes bacterium]|nr:class I SAM-dependent methyltransferase [Bacteroidota bacterium]
MKFQILKKCKIMNQRIDYKKYLENKRNCVVCENDQFAIWCQDGVFNVLECNNCGLVFVNPCLNNEGLDLVYSGHHSNRISNPDECKKREPMYILDRNFLEGNIDHGNILDVGCGGGFFLEKFNPEKWKRVGLEIDPDTRPYAEKHFGINVEIGTSEKMPFENESYDVVSFRGSFEHLVNPDLTMKEVARVTRKGGYLYFSATPNVNSFCARLYRQKWNQFDAKEHIFMFSVETLEKLVEPFGFKAVNNRFFYEETPYCNIDEDMMRVMNDYKLIKEGQFDSVDVSPPFWGNMLNILFKKV